MIIKKTLITALTCLFSFKAFTSDDLFDKQEIPKITNNTELVQYATQLYKEVDRNLVISSILSTPLEVNYPSYFSHEQLEQMHKNKGIFYVGNKALIFSMLDTTAPSLGNTDKLDLQGGRKIARLTNFTHTATFGGSVAKANKEKVKRQEISEEVGRQVLLHVSESSTTIAPSLKTGFDLLKQPERAVTAALTAIITSKLVRYALFPEAQNLQNPQPYGYFCLINLSTKNYVDKFTFQEILNEYMTEILDQLTFMAAEIQVTACSLVNVEE